MTTTTQQHAASSSVKQLDGEPIDYAAPGLEDAMESLLKILLSWQFGTWDRVNKGYRRIWDPVFTKAQFEALDREYPELKM